MNVQHSSKALTFAILGGGIAGLTTAVALKKIGIEAQVFEAAPEFKPVGAGLTLAVNAMKAFDYLGLYQEVLNHGKAFDQLSILSPSGQEISRAETENVDGGLVNIAIHRASLHEVLLGQLDTSQVVTNKQIQDIEPHEEESKVIFTDGTSIIAKYIIACEGINSVARQKLLPDSVKRYSGYTCWRGIADNSNIGVRQPFETWGKQGRFGTVSLTENRLYWFAVKNAPENDNRMKNLTRNDLIDNFKDYHSPVGMVIHATKPEDIILNDIYDLKPVSRYAHGNIVLLGDAAHATTPNMGQGACMAIEDAVVLADCVKNHVKVEDAFKAFERKRMKRTHDIVNQSWRIGKVAQWENPLAISLRNFLFGLLPPKFYKKQIEKIYDFNL